MKPNENIAVALAAFDHREAELQRQVATAQAALAGAIDEGTDRDRGDLKDAADEAATEVVDDAQLARDLAELREIALARRRIEEGFYGVCVDCGATIPEARLVARPTAGRCIDCQQAIEQQASLSR
jgi:phage/conjugal plasmid C-4 type zinc finger TraR family protein